MEKICRIFIQYLYQTQCLSQSTPLSPLLQPPCAQLSLKYQGQDLCRYQAHHFYSISTQYMSVWSVSHTSNGTAPLLSSEHCQNHWWPIFMTVPERIVCRYRLRTEPVADFAMWARHSVRLFFKLYQRAFPKLAKMNCWLLSDKTCIASQCLYTQPKMFFRDGNIYKYLFFLHFFTFKCWRDSFYCSRRSTVREVCVSYTCHFLARAW